jgi:hypothetical protein
LAGFFQPFTSFSIDSFTLVALVCSLRAVTIHSRYSFLLVNESPVKNPALFYAPAKPRKNHQARLIVFVAALTYLKISRSFGDQFLLFIPRCFQPGPEGTPDSIKRDEADPLELLIFQ